MGKSDDLWAKEWERNWAWILEEYGDLEKKLKEKTETSQFLTRILEEKKIDPRKLRYFPKTTNQRYGWIASHKEFQLERFGSDMYVPKPIPEIYKLIY